MKTRSVPSMRALFHSFSQPDEAARRAGAYGVPGNGNMSNVRWVDSGQFFTAPADFTDPVQGGIPGRHFISALASLAWAKYLIAQKTRPIAASDSFQQAPA
jgi:hypothetical protein